MSRLALFLAASLLVPACAVEDTAAGPHDLGGGVDAATGPTANCTPWMSRFSRHAKEGGRNVVLFGRGAVNLTRESHAPCGDDEQRCRAISFVQRADDATGDFEIVARIDAVSGDEDDYVALVVGQQTGRGAFAQAEALPHGVGASGRGEETEVAVDRQLGGEAGPTILRVRRQDGVYRATAERGGTQATIGEVSFDGPIEIGLVLPEPLAERVSATISDFAVDGQAPVAADSFDCPVADPQP